MGADDTHVRLAEEAAGTRGLDLLLLFGSRARGDAHEGSDWDLGYLADDDFEPMAFLARSVETLRSDRIDLVNLRSASGLLRYRAARDGRVIFERRPDLGDRFKIEAVSFWSDAAPVLERAYEGVLTELDR